MKVSSIWQWTLYPGYLFFTLYGYILLAHLTESHISLHPSRTILLPRRISNHEKLLRISRQSLSPQNRHLHLTSAQKFSRNSRQAPSIRALYSAPDIPALYSAPGLSDERTLQNDNDQDKVTTEVYMQDAEDFEEENSSEISRYGAPTESYNDIMIDDEMSMEQESQAQTESPQQPDLQYLPPNGFNNDTDSGHLDETTDNSDESVTEKEPSEKYGPPQEDTYSDGKAKADMKPSTQQEKNEMSLPPGYLPPVYNPPKTKAAQAASYDLKETEDFGQLPPNSGYNTIPPNSQLSGKGNRDDQKSHSENSDGENEDEFEGLNENIVDAKLLDRVKQIIEDHEQQQRAAGNSNPMSTAPSTDIQYLPPRGGPSGYSQNPTKSITDLSGAPRIDIQKAVLSQHYSEAEPQSTIHTSNQLDNHLHDIAGPGQAYLPPRSSPSTSAPQMGYVNQIDAVQYQLPKFDHQNEVSQTTFWPSTSSTSGSGSYYYDSPAAQPIPRPSYGLPLAPVISLESYTPTSSNEYRQSDYNTYSGEVDQPASNSYLPPREELISAASDTSRVDKKQFKGDPVSSTLLLAPSSTYFTYENAANFEPSSGGVPSLSTTFSVPTQDYSEYQSDLLLTSPASSFLPPNQQFFYQNQNTANSFPNFYTNDRFTNAFESSSSSRVQRNSSPVTYSYIHRGSSKI